jgi:hypothetical protein
MHNGTMTNPEPRTRRCVRVILAAPAGRGAATCAGALTGDPAAAAAHPAAVTALTLGRPGERRRHARGIRPGAQVLT